MKRDEIIFRMKDERIKERVQRELYFILEKVTAICHTAEVMRTGNYNNTLQETT